MIISGLFCPQCGEEKLFKKKSDVAQSGRARYSCRVCKSRTTRPLSEPPQKLPKFKKERRNVYLITQAVNDTPVVEGFLRALESMAEKLAGQLVVIQGVYKNPDMAKRGFLETLTWPAEILPYFCNKDFPIGKHLVVRGGTRIEHCAVNPLNGMNHSNGTQSEIFGHSQLAMEIVPAPKNEVPRMLITTGTVSKRNYGGSPRAKKASFHHNNSALLIETQGDRFWVRPIAWDAKGGFIQDLKTRYYADGTTQDNWIEAAIFGDIHADVMQPNEKKSILALMHKLDASCNVLHDVLDMHSGSHHKKGDVLHNLRHPDHDVLGELIRTCKFLDQVPEPRVIISSNHHDHLDKWFSDFNPRTEQVNLDTYFLLGELARRHKAGLFELYCTHVAGVACEFPNRNQVYDICGIDVGQHGDRGPNGARGSGKAFARTGRKTITGHSHTPGIHKGNWTVGTSAMHMDYAKGYSSWLEAHALIYPNGKRTMIFRIKGKYSPMVEAL